MNLHSCVSENAIHRDGHQPFHREVKSTLDDKTIGQLHVLAWRLEQEAKGRK